jgi:quinol monooxygenase YgiN
MYGTIARFRIKPGMEQQLKQLIDEFGDVDVAGFRAEYLYRTDADPQAYFMVAMFDSKETYFANADDPAQDTRYRKFRALLESDPEWNDGEIVFDVSKK